LETAISTDPSLSVIMTVYDGLPYVVDAVQSVFADGYADLELIVVDDGSTDGTADALTQIADPRLRVLRSDHIGRVAALNAAVAQARGQFVANLDADDVVVPGRFGASVAYLQAHPDVAAVGASVVPVLGAQHEARSLPKTDRGIRWSFLLRNPMTHSSVTFRATALAEVGGYDPSYDKRCQDADLFLRLAARHRLANIGQPLIHKRLHEGQHFAGIDRRVRADVHVRLRRRAARELRFPVLLRPVAQAVAGCASLRSRVTIGMLGHGGGPVTGTVRPTAVEERS
jgi:glycosyltransferase involved in cell wall biosynthesis